MIRAVALIATAALAASASAKAPQRVLNGVQFVDTDGEFLHSHGGGVIEVDNYYYWFGENRNDDFTFKSIDAYRSRDLKTWELTRTILSQASDPELQIANIERPKVIFNRLTGMFVLWMHKENGIHYGEARAAVAVCDEIDGDYKWLGSFRPFDEHMSRDITVFVDDDGVGYMTSSARENYDLHIYRLTPDFTTVEELIADPWHGGHREAPALWKRHGIYFMLTSGATGWNPNQQQYATATNISGPWSPMYNVGDNTCFGSQTAFVLPVTGNDGTTEYLYMGDRWGPAFGARVVDSRYVWLPIDFPTATSMDLQWTPELMIDADAGTVRPVPAAYYSLEARHSGRCADITSQSLLEGAEIKQYDCWGGGNQRFWMRDIGGGFQLVARSSSFCIQENAAGQYLTQEACSDDLLSQQWQIIQTGAYYTITSRASGRCLDVANGGSNNGEGLLTYACNGQANQEWTLRQ